MSVLFLNRYEPSTGYTWDFDTNHEDLEDENDLLRRIHRNRKNKMNSLTHQTEMSEYDDEHIRASEAIDRILVGLSDRKLV